jgi:hypothetical protein
MGAHSFQEHSRTSDVGKAYSELVDTAAFENGNSSYSGTIATTRGYRIVSETLMTPAQADDLMEQRIHNLSKWEACEVVRVGMPKKTKKRNVVVKGLTEVATARDAASALGVPLSQVVSVKRLEHNTKHDFVTTASPARVWVWDDGHRKRGEFATKAEAVKALKEAMKNSRWPQGDEQHRVYQRSSTSEITCKVKEVVTKLEVVLAAGPLEFSSWCFYGWAAS